MNEAYDVDLSVCAESSMWEDAVVEGRPADVDIAVVGAMFGDRARVAILTGILDKPRSSAGELARRAGIAPSTAAGHLRKLLEAGLITSAPSGRLRLYDLASAEVADAIEALGVLAPTIPVSSLRQSRAADALHGARTCYDHLAGRLGVMLHDQLLRHGFIRRAGARDYELTPSGEDLCARLGIDVYVIRRSRRVFARACLDWSQRTPHLAGALGAALLTEMLERGWLSRGHESRSLRITKAGVRGLPQWFGVTP
jgi:DNA-binding transcriptional ArsR family regulator